MLHGKHGHFFLPAILLFAAGMAYWHCAQTHSGGTPQNSGSDATAGTTGMYSKPALPRTEQQKPVKKTPRVFKVVHVFVCLCDNVNQGIVKVPKSLGNGQDSRNNLYWGAMYGVKTFFKRSKHWSLVKCETKPDKSCILDRVVFRSTGTRPVVYVTADAYNGAQMKETLTDFLNAAAGRRIIKIKTTDGVKIQTAGYADMVCFVGHNGLMDFSLSSYPANTEKPNPECAVVLACKSNSYFIEPLKKAGCRPLITTTGFMAPEAYTLDAIIRAWASGGTPSEIRQQAGGAYAKYQKISRRAALRIFNAAEK
jgi:hypothetical protein